MEPYYSDALTTIYHGECLAVMAELVPASFDAIICDPPYGTTACAWDSVIPFEPMWAQLKRLIKPRGAIVLFGSQPFTSALIMSNPQMFRYEWVWDKVNRITGFLDAQHRPLRVAENICVFSSSGRSTYNPQMTKGKPYKARHGKSGSVYNADRSVWTICDGERYPQNILRIPADNRGQEGRIHPTQKPLELMEYLIKTYTNEGDRVLDFTFGSGTTLRAAKNLSSIPLLAKSSAKARLLPPSEQRCLTVSACFWKRLQSSTYQHRALTNLLA
jgi:site-specific DNA-methyltransferase (adenine-specific)